MEIHRPSFEIRKKAEGRKPKLRAVGIFDGVRVGVDLNLSITDRPQRFELRKLQEFLTMKPEALMVSRSAVILFDLRFTRRCGVAGA